MKDRLWHFTDTQGTFESETAQGDPYLYFPLCNNHLLSSITPSLHGDIKRDQHSFLLEPASRIDLNNSKSNRNFWIYINSKKIWSLAGRHDRGSLSAGLLWHSIKRSHNVMGLSAEITSFIPSSGEPVEIMMVNLINISKKPVVFSPTAAIPLYCRSADTARDHRHVTSLLNRIEKTDSGIIVTPTLLFNEAGHKKNNTSYFVLGADELSRGPEDIFCCQEEFAGSGDLAMPDAIYKNLLPDQHRSQQGKEVMAGLKFKKTRLKPGDKTSYCIVMGIADDKRKISGIFSGFNSIQKCLNALNKTKAFWGKTSSQISLATGNTRYDYWVRWVSIQPTLRTLFGCSFLPDFDYGKGGRGWRDLWQDALSITLTNPAEARDLLINNFYGVRIDSSNATIIGKKKGEFIADRNNIARVWMDHGVWPLITTLFYINQSGDINILLQEVPYFKDSHISRGREIDPLWNKDSGTKQKTLKHTIYTGSILEHVLLQNLVQFFNVGVHNICRLENADWNDGLDMAFEHGESVPFTCMYAMNLKNICYLVSNLKLKHIPLLKEISILLDTVSQHPLDYTQYTAKIKLLESYFAAINKGISGEKINIQTSALVKDLSAKAEWVMNLVQKNEWLPEGFYNGYYDNHKKRLEGTVKENIRMTLTAQVFPIMSGIASENQIRNIWKNSQKHLQDKKLGGFRLNTDFKEEMHSLGRAFSFAYGNKENGSFFNHMCVMFAYALYSRGFAQEGYEVLHSIYTMAVNTEKSRIYPCLPEYFDNDGQGMYSYLTGSASWYLLAVLTQVFGIRGENGNLVIEPKLVKKQFMKDTLSIATTFAGRQIKVIYNNPGRKDYGSYNIKQVAINNKKLPVNTAQYFITIPLKKFLSFTKQNQLNTIDLFLN